MTRSTKAGLSGLLLVAAMLSLVAPSPALAETLRLEVAGASVRTDPRTGEGAVGVLLAPESARRFQTFTAARIGRRISIRFDGKELLAPVLREPISVTFHISGGLSAEDARRLTRQLKPGVEIDVEAMDHERAAP